MEELDVYTGTLEYRNIVFTFVFDKKILRLIPPNEEKSNVSLWFKEKIARGVYGGFKQVYIDENLIGKCNERNKQIVFILDNNEVEICNCVLIIEINYYIINDYVNKMIDKIIIYGPEINYIYSKKVNYLKLKEDNTFDIDRDLFNDTVSDREHFKIDDRTIDIYFGISVFSNHRIEENPLKIDSTLSLEFEPTNDYKFIVRLLDLMRKFIQYLCFRKNINFTSVKLAGFVTENIHFNFAELYEISEYKTIDNASALKKGRVIKYEYVKGAIGRIIEDIYKNRIYLKHIPDSYESEIEIDAGKFVMITAGFEWEFKRNYPKGIVKNKKTVVAENHVIDLIDTLIQQNTGKSKEILKFLKKQIKSYNLGSQIVQYGKDYGDISDIFGNKLYSLVNEKLSYEKIGDRLSNQRNHFAHGDIDCEFIGSSLFDVLYLEYIIYIMQLKYYEIGSDKIKLAINDLFECHLPL